LSQPSVIQDHFHPPSWRDFSYSRYSSVTFESLCFARLCFAASPCYVFLPFDTHFLECLLAQLGIISPLFAFLFPFLTWTEALLIKAYELTHPFGTLECAHPPVKFTMKNGYFRLARLLPPLIPIYAGSTMRTLGSSVPNFSR